jgi:DNA-binding Xre family transcriptional regulator
MTLLPSQALFDTFYESVYIYFKHTKNPRIEVSTLSIRSKLKPLADARGRSIREIARDIDYRFESVRMMYNDEMERYPRDLLTKLCDYFECGVGDLLTPINDNVPLTRDNTPE